MVDVKIENVLLNTGIDLELAQSTQPANFTIAHISDLHLTSLDNVKIPQLLNKRMLGYFSWRHKRRFAHRREIIDALLEDMRATQPDHIAVTGDLTHLGLPMEYAEVKEWLPSLGTPERVTLIPGNHEAYSGGNWFRLCGMWAPYLESDRDVASPQTAGFFPSLRIRSQVAFIGLCSATPSLPLLAIGSLGQKQLAALGPLLQEMGERGLFRVVLVHHPPVPAVVKWRKRLTDSKALAAVLSQYGAELVLHGHAHTPALSELRSPAGNIPVVGAPATSELSLRTGNNAKYNIYRLRRTAANWELSMSVRGYSEAKGRFIAEEEMVLDLPHSKCAELPKS